ncbi:hypothetical protein GQ600_16957 [Phytophthora cactorum]|nr:hypothetical protein GQ600_16957 [Phytophthora cactorum]
MYYKSARNLEHCEKRLNRGFHAVRTDGSAHDKHRLSTSPKLYTRLSALQSVNVQATRRYKGKDMIRLMRYVHYEILNFRTCKEGNDATIANPSSSLIAGLDRLSGRVARASGGHAIILLGLNTLLFASRESEAESVDPSSTTAASSSVKSQSANMHVTDISTSDWDQIVIEEHTTNKHMWHLYEMDRYEHFGAPQPNCYSTADQQVEITNSWNRSSLNITEQQERRGAAQATAALNADNSHDGTSGEVSTEYFTSPPLSSSQTTRNLGTARILVLLPTTVSRNFDPRTIPAVRSDTSMTNLAMQDAMELVTFKLGQRTASTLAMRQEPAALESKQQRQSYGVRTVQVFGAATTTT